MKTTRVSIALLAGIFGAFAAILSSAQSAQEVPARFGVLEDQNGREWDLDAELADAPSILIFSDQRDGDERVTAWRKILERELPNGNIHTLLSLKGLPFFVPRNAVKDQIQKTAPYPTLLDWKGRTGEILGAPRSQTSIFVFREQGAPVLAAQGIPTESSIRAVKEAALFH